MNRIFVPLVLLSVIPSAALASGPDSIQSIEAPDEPQTIYGGEISGACSWPTTVHLGVPGCTGTLVHPQVVIYAAHCGDSYSSVHFGQKGAGGVVDIERCEANPGYGPKGTDFAYCILAEPVTDIPLVPILMGDEVDVLQADRPVTIVGFGGNDIDAECGSKLEAETIYHSTDSGEALVGGDGIDTCFGDSGGPVYVQLDDGTWRVFGITSYATSNENPQSCGGITRYSMMHVGMEWFESASGFDLTPCHNADGSPSGDACADAPTDPGAAKQSWCTWEIDGPSSCGGGGGPPPGDTSNGEGACGWNSAGSYYVCGGDGEDPMGSAPIECPAGGVVEGEPCDELTYEGCCDCNGNTWWCEEGVVVFRGCTEQTDECPGWGGGDESSGEGGGDGSVDGGAESAGGTDGGSLTSSAGESDAAQDDEASGCGCTSHRGGRGAGWLLALPIIAWARRRRRNAGR